MTIKVEAIVRMKKHLTIKGEWEILKSDDVKISGTGDVFWEYLKDSSPEDRISVSFCGADGSVSSSWTYPQRLVVRNLSMAADRNSKIKISDG